jgi:cytochrome c556
MTALGKDSEVLGDIVAGLQPAARLPAVTQSIAAGAREARDSFREVVPGGRTKPAAWTDQADFNRRMDAFARNAETMAAAGAKGDVVAVTGLMVEAMPCKECHDLYREPKKPG